MSNLAAWLIPSQAHHMIQDVRARNAWGEVPWGEEGAALNVLDELGESYTDVVGLPLEVVLQHFVRPEFVVHAHELVGWYALDLMWAAYEVYRDPAPWLSWECLELMVRRTWEDGPQDICGWMMDRGIWRLPLTPHTLLDRERIYVITKYDVRFWERVMLHTIDDYDMIYDGTEINPEARRYMHCTHPDYPQARR